MIVQHYDVVQCSICKQTKFGGTVLREEQDSWDTGYAVCDDCKNEWDKKSNQNRIPNHLNS